MKHDALEQRLGYGQRRASAADFAFQPPDLLSRPLSILDRRLTRQVRLGFELMMMHIRGFRKDAFDWHAAFHAIRNQDMINKLWAAITAEDTRRQRWVDMLGNHLTVSSHGYSLQALTSVWENEVLQAHGFGRYEDLLLAATLHPTMLIYLDQLRSMTRDMQMEGTAGLGFNENLGRELLELHSVGVDAGYSQQDVEALSRMLTGWTLSVPDGHYQPTRGVALADIDTGRYFDPAADYGQVIFREDWHDPDARQLMGTPIEATGAEQAKQAIRFLANHPATRRRLAHRVAVHYIDDAGDDQAEAEFLGILNETGGDLGALFEHVQSHRSVRNRLRTKIKAPWDHLVSTCRAAGVTELQPPDVVALIGLRQRPYFAPSPEGWSDQGKDWADPVSLTAQATSLRPFLARISDDLELPRLFGLQPGGNSIAALGQVGDPVEQRLLAALSPEFLRR